MHAPMQVTFFSEFRTHENISHRGPHLANKTSHVSYSPDVHLVSSNTICDGVKKKQTNKQKQQPQNLTKIHLELALLLYKCTGILSKENTKGEKQLCHLSFSVHSPLRKASVAA